MTVSEDRMEQLRRVKRAHEAELMRRPNVVGVGIGFRERGGERTEEPVIVVSVTEKIPQVMLEPEETIPRELDGISVDVQSIGEPRALDRAQGGHVD